MMLLSCLLLGGLFVALLWLYVHLLVKYGGLKKEAEVLQKNNSIKEEQLEIAANPSSDDPLERMRNGNL